MLENGFLGYNASFMLDFVVCALILVVPVLIYSLYLVKIQKRFTAHRNVQLGLAVVLLIAVGLFEVDLQLVHGGWENVVNKDARNPRLASETLEFVEKILWVHLVFAISTPILWAVTIVLALKRFPKPVMPGTHSSLHRKLGWASMLDLVLTSITGLIFYYYAFMV